MGDVREYVGERLTQGDKKLPVVLLPGDVVRDPETMQEVVIGRVIRVLVDPDDLRGEE